MSCNTAVLIPIYNSAQSPPEKLSIRHLEHFLANADKYILSPKNLKNISSPYPVKYFDEVFFTNPGSYSQLLLSSRFYKEFSDYPFILIYQLDCLIFSEQLEFWYKSGYDYIGAPFFWDKSDPNKGFSRVGNGGFSQRKVSSFLKVLNSRRVPRLGEVFKAGLPDLKHLPLIKRFIKTFKVFRDARLGVKMYIQNYTLNEDLFWSDRAKLFYPEFNIAPVKYGLKFSFEMFPRYCYKRNGRRLPFGCHAWSKWDRTFWEPYLLIDV